MPTTKTLSARQIALRAKRAEIARQFAADPFLRAIVAQAHARVLAAAR